MSYNVSLTNNTYTPNKDFSGGDSLRYFASDKGRNSQEAAVIIEVLASTGIKDRLVDLPRRFNLYQNYPNPFNPVTSIEYELPERSFVDLIIYDVLGQKVKTLVNEVQPSDTYRVNWDGKNEKGRLVSSGVYFYQIKTRDFTKTRKMILLR